MTEDNCINRINKLDSFFLWIASLVGVGFTIFIGYFKLPWVLYLPIFILIGYSIYIGYLQGAVFYDSFTNRIRGWNYLLIGLSIYIPLTAIKYSESYFKSTFLLYPSLESILSISVGLGVLASYVIISKRIAAPSIYKSFGNPYGEVTKKIQNRTIQASFVLGFILYILVVALNPFSLNISLLLYIIFIGMLIVPLVSQERKISKLIPIEKYQQYLQIEPVEKKFYFNIFMAVISIITLAILTISQFPKSNLQIALTLFLFLIFVGCILGMYISMIYADRGDMIIKKETFENQPTKEEMEDLNKSVNNANS